MSVVVQPTPVHMGSDVSEIPKSFPDNPSPSQRDTETKIVKSLLNLLGSPISGISRGIIVTLGDLASISSSAADLMVDSGILATIEPFCVSSQPPLFQVCASLFHHRFRRPLFSRSCLFSVCPAFFS
ncbi:hypothetical protein BLNAU_16079 [Blattamonas nauphoetae]|uniref:Uncharacterized protein n=1 Tax=Blattamonas nauphoetae TaxID=2049346 RepID=A0ABQ9X922_9EUKA|nr:hypothetical protein BLNAU_16079 [Blattamonas nauphoetae]